MFYIAYIKIDMFGNTLYYDLQTTAYVNRNYGVRFCNYNVLPCRYNSLKS